MDNHKSFITNKRLLPICALGPRVCSASGRTKWINCKPNEIQRLGRNPGVVSVSLSVPLMIRERGQVGKEGVHEV